MGLREHLKSLGGKIGRLPDKLLGPKPDSSASATGAQGPPPMGMAEADMDAAGFPQDLTGGNEGR